MDAMDTRNDPAGYAERERPQRYRIREVLQPRVIGGRYQLRGTEDGPYELGACVERVTVVSMDPVNHRHYHALQEADQLFADLCTRLVQEACRWFYDEQWESLPGVPDLVLTDEQVRTSIERLDLGENKREADRVGKVRYVLTDLPWQRQRALIEQLYALRREFGFEKLGPA